MKQNLHPIGHPHNRWWVNEQEVDLSREPLMPRRVSIPSEPQRITVDLNRTAIIVVDMQNDFCTPGGWLDHIGVDVTPARRPITPLQNLIPALRAARVPIIWLNWGNRPDRLNLSPSVLHVYKPSGVGIGLGDPLPGNGSPVLQRDSWAASVVDELTQEASDVLVDKYRMSGFWDTPLNSILLNTDVKSLLFSGVNLDQCVMATLQDANFLGYDCILLEDCTATTSPEYCRQATLYNIKQCYGFVSESSDWIDALAAYTDDRKSVSLDTKE